MTNVDDEDRVDTAPEPQAPVAQSPGDVAKVPMDKLARVYRKMHTKLQEIETRYETEKAAIVVQQDIVKNAMKDQMLALGVSSVRTEFGTVTLGQKTRYSTQDWDEFKSFIVTHNAVDLLERRIQQTNMAAFLADNPGTVPPGLNSMTEYTVSVRRPS